MKKSMKEINRQLNKEALATLGLYVFFFLWWFCTAYGLGNIDLRFWGLPAWFFFSCVVGWLLCCVGVAIIVKKWFKHIDLDEYIYESDEGGVRTNER